MDTEVELALTVTSFRKKKLGKKKSAWYKQSTYTSVF